MRFRRFTKPEFLRKVGRPLLGRLFGRFATDLEASGVPLPAADLDDDAYFSALAKVAMSPDALSPQIIEDLFAIEAMANYEGEERLRAGATQFGLKLEFAPDSTCEDLVVQTYLAHPGLVAQKHSELRLVRLSSFEYYRRSTPQDRSATFTAPDQAVLDLMTRDLNAWFREHNRGDQTVRIDLYEMDGEYWLVIRHGDNYARTPKVDRGQFAIVHFRPTKDDVIVYCPRRDEIRIHAATKGERQLYRNTIGLRLLGDPWHFNRHEAYTLNPLRDAGIDALDATGIDGLTRVVLRELEYAFDNPNADVLIHKAEDLFCPNTQRPMGANPIPTEAALLRATFDVYFGKITKPRKVQLRPPNILKLGRHCDTRLVDQWLSERGFRGSVGALEASE